MTMAALFEDAICALLQTSSVESLFSLPSIRAICCVSPSLHQRVWRVVWSLSPTLERHFPRHAWARCMGANVLSLECLLIRLHVRTLGVHGVFVLQSSTSRHRREIMPLCPPPSSPPNAYFCGPVTLLCDGSVALQPLSVCKFIISAATNPVLTTWLCLTGEGQGRITQMSRSSYQTFDAPAQARLRDSVLALMHLLERVTFALIVVLLCLRAVALPVLLPAFHPLDLASALVILRLFVFAARSGLGDNEHGKEPAVRLGTLAVVACGMAGCGRVLAYSSVWNVVVGKRGKLPLSLRQCFCYCLMLVCEVAWGALCGLEFLDLTAHSIEMLALYIVFFKDSGMFRVADGDRIDPSRFKISAFRAFSMSAQTRRLWTIAAVADFLVIASAIPLILVSVFEKYQA
jgi:hypothetical protein